MPPLQPLQEECELLGGRAGGHEEDPRAPGQRKEEGGERNKEEDPHPVQARVGEDEVLGVRAPGLNPGFNAQYEVNLCNSYQDVRYLCPWWSASWSSTVIPGVDRLRVHLGLEPGGAAPGRPRVALHARLQDAAQVGAVVKQVVLVLLMKSDIISGGGSFDTYAG